MNRSLLQALARHNNHIKWITTNVIMAWWEIFSLGFSWVGYRPPCCALKGLWPPFFWEKKSNWRNDKRDPVLQEVVQQKDICSLLPGVQSAEYRHGQYLTLLIDLGTPKRHRGGGTLHNNNWWQTKTTFNPIYLPDILWRRDPCSSTNLHTFSPFLHSQGSTHIVEL